MKPIVYIVANSPGEVSTFVRPVVAALQDRFPQWELQVCLVPCPYATGAETRVIESWSHPPAVWTPWQTTKAWWSGAGRGRQGAVLFLGGDPWHALLLKHRFGLPAVAYFSEPSGWEKTRWLGGFDSVLLGYRSAQANPSQMIGDLRVDTVLNALRTTPRNGQEKTLTLALFPGSRRLHLKASLGVFLKVVDDIATDQLQVLLAASPFITPQRLAEIAAKPLNWGVANVKARLEGDTLITEGGSRVEVIWSDPYQAMARCDLALSLPGTNTAELAIAGKPTVVPLHSRAPVGGGGLLGLLEFLPGLEPLKRHLKLRKKKRLKLLALPNQLAGKMVMPELFVDDDMGNLSEFLRELLADGQRRKSIGDEARAVMGPPGASNRVADELALWFDKRDELLENAPR